MSGVEVHRVEPPHAGDEFIAFHASGARIVGELHCCDCGYGIVSRGLLPVCPMCRGSTWEGSPGRLFSAS